MRRTIVRFAENHRGLVTRSQLKTSGASASRIRNLQRSRRLRSVRPGVYAVVGSAPTWKQGLQAIVLSVPGSAASHWCSIRLVGIRVAEARYEITVPRRRQTRLAGVVAHRATMWLPEDTVVRQGIPCASAARTVVDLSGQLDADELGRLVDELLRRRVLRLRDLARTAGRLPAARGRRPAVVREVLAARLEGYEPGDSEREARTVRLLLAAGLPAPTAQHRVRIGSRRYRVDLAYPDRMVAIEIDSWEYHRWRSAFDGDRARRNELTIRGYAVIQVTDGMPDHEIVRTVRGALDSALVRSAAVAASA